MSAKPVHADGRSGRLFDNDVSIRPGWFYHPTEDAKVKTTQQLVDLYFTSVGRNSKLLLNVPPTRDGLLHETDVANLRGMRAELDAMQTRGVRTKPTWQVDGPTVARLNVDLEFPNSISVIELAEDIREGQRVTKWELFASDQPSNTAGMMAMTKLASGSTIGCKQLRKIPVARASFLMLRVETQEPPLPVTLRCYR